MFLQLLYVSSAAPGAIDLDALLAKSQANNARDEITGLLYTDGKRFLQAIEGPVATVEDTFLRIIGDERHRSLVLLSRRLTQSREFGPWAMARRTFDDGYDDFMARIAALCEAADPSVRGTFEGLIAEREKRAA